MTADQEKTYTITITDENGDRREIEISTGQLLDAAAFRAFSHFVDAEYFVEENGHIVSRESAIPPREAA